MTRSTPGPAGLPLFLDKHDLWEQAQADIDAVTVTDGLPVVPPTRQRLSAMLAQTRRPDQCDGYVPPLYGRLTAENVAYYCVLAGCRPDHFPVVRTAVTACLEPDFNLLGIQTTTGSPTVAVVLHGPVANRVDANADSNCLGPGNRANACIGRAVQLALAGIGHAQPGFTDMATMGQPGKYIFCFAENDQSPYPPLHARRELSPVDDAVTVIGATGSIEILPQHGAATTSAILNSLSVTMIAENLLSADASQFGSGEQFLLIPPEIASQLNAECGTLHQLQTTLFEQATAANNVATPVAESPNHIHPIVTGGVGIKMTYIPTWSGGTRSITKKIRT